MAVGTKKTSLKELAAKYGSGAVPVPATTLRNLQKDPRVGAQRLYRQLKKRRDREKKEQARLDGLLHFERLLWRAGLERIAGVDEVGIGPMAGPVVAAAVVFPPGARIDGIDDSKRLDPDLRDSLEFQIRGAVSGVGVGVVESEEVDRLNVYHAGLKAMRLAVESLPAPPQHILVDSRTIPELSQPQNSFNKGDGINFSIACASIVAKVYRDRLMNAMDRAYPGYGFARHKGYCTPAHQDAVRRLGPCAIHRRSFDFIRELRGEYDPVFYSLKQELQAVASLQELQAWEVRMDSLQSRLPPAETRKLRVLAGRRWKRLNPA